MDKRKIKVGDKITIIDLVDEPYKDNYIGVEGVVEYIETDYWGDERMAGTWGGIYIYIDKDKYEIID